MITTKRHNQIVEHKDKTINDYFKKILVLEGEIIVGHQKHLDIVAKLDEELRQARDLKSIINKLFDNTNNITANVRSCCIGGVLNLPDTVLQYTDDILGGKVIKQEGTKCLVIDVNGNVKTGLTKQKRDTKYTYKLIRE